MSVRRYQELADELERQIRAGVFPPGAALPSVRRLRRERSVSMTTASEALAELERRGLAEASPRSGFYVRPPDPRLPAPELVPGLGRPRRVPLPHLADDFVTASADRRLVPLGGAVLAPELLPLARLRALARAELADAAGVFASYGPPSGDPGLRRVLARHLRPRGLAVTPDEVVVTSGCMDAIRTALLAIAPPGSTVAVESPTFFGFLGAIRDLGYLALEVPADPVSGLNTASLRDALARYPVRSLIVTPTLHNPTGATLSAAARGEIVEICSAHGVTIIEDDIYGDLLFDGTSRPPLASFGGDVVYCSSFSKTLTPGLRVGFMVPGRHLGVVRRLRLSGTIAPPSLNQRVIARYLDEGDHERHLRRLRGALRQQVDAVRRSLEQVLPPGSAVTRPLGGFLLWVRPGVDAMALHEAALREGISIGPGPLYAVDGAFSDHIRLSCGHPFGAELAEAVRTLGRLVERLRH